MSGTATYPSGYDRCSECGGHGIVERWTGNDVDVVDCPTCRGAGLERARDERGRFARASASAGEPEQATR